MKTKTNPPKADVAAETPSPRLLTTREAAERLAIGLRTLQRLTAAGRLPCVRIGQAVRYRPADLAALVDQCLTVAA